MGDNLGVPPILLVPADAPPTLPQKCWFCNFHAVFGDFGLNPSPSIDSKWANPDKSLQDSLLKDKSVNFHHRNFEILARKTCKAKNDMYTYLMEVMFQFLSHDMRRNFVLQTEKTTKYITVLKVCPPCRINYDNSSKISLKRKKYVCSLEKKK